MDLRFRCRPLCIHDENNQIFYIRAYRQSMARMQIYTCIYNYYASLCSVQKSGVDALPVAECGGGSGLNWDSNVIL